jgi:cold-inducible RNA-binding protein
LKRRKAWKLLAIGQIQVKVRRSIGLLVTFKRHGGSSSELWFSDDLKPGSREQSTESKVSLGTFKHHMDTKLFVGNLSFNTTENDLQDAFAAHGTVVEANLMMDRMSGRPRGFAFVTMSTPEEAQKAIAALNGASLDGRDLTVNLARPREERPAGAGGGSGGGGRRGFGGGGGGGRNRY